MNIIKFPKNTQEILNILETKQFDPDIDSYYPELLAKHKNIFHDLNNQFYYIYDFYKKRIVYVSKNLVRILGYTDFIANFPFFYDIIHPADRLLIYKATMKSIFMADKYKGTAPFDYVFSMDFRIKKINGDYIRVLRHTGVAENDRQGNMVFSFALYTDITSIKKSNKVNFSLHTKTPPRYQFPDEELLLRNNIFTKQETNIISFLSKGISSKVISDELCISIHTVDTHRRNMLKKAKLKNTAELVIYAKEHEII